MPLLRRKAVAPLLPPPSRIAPAPPILRAARRAAAWTHRPLRRASRGRAGGRTVDRGRARAGTRDSVADKWTTNSQSLRRADCTSSALRERRGRCAPSVSFQRCTFLHGSARNAMIAGAETTKGRRGRRAASGAACQGLNNNYSKYGPRPGGLGGCEYLCNSTYWARAAAN